MSNPISEIKEIKPELKVKLETEGIRNTEQFLRRAGLRISVQNWLIK